MWWLPAVVLPGLLLTAASAAPVTDAWGVKPVLGVTLTPERAAALDECGLDGAEIDALLALGGDIAAEADAWRRAGDEAIRRGQPQVPAVYDQPLAVAALAAEERADAEALLGARVDCFLDRLDEGWQEDRRRGVARLASYPGPSYTTVTLTYNVFATQYAANTSQEVAIPDYCIKFANLGWGDCSAGYTGDPYNVILTRGSYVDTVWVGDVGPWNIDDNYWNTPSDPNRPRRLYTDLPQGMNESRAAYYDNYNSGRDQYNRTVSNPAGIDLAVPEAADIGLAYLQNDWIDVTYTWETTTIYPSLSMGLAFDPRSDQPADAVPDGASAGIYDVWEDQPFQVRVRVANSGSASANTTLLGVEVGAPNLHVTGWEVYTDSPYQDAASWTRDASSDDAGNPAPDAPGDAFTLRIGTLAPYETKEIRLVVAGGIPGAGAPVHAWVSHVDNVYEKSGYDAAPTNVGNHQTWNGGDLKVGGVADTWPVTTRWAFTDTTEGWYAANAATVAAVAGQLRLDYDGDDPILVGPPTDAVAAASDTLALTLTTSGASEAKVYWSTVEAPGFSEDRALAFAVPAATATTTVTVPIGTAPGWAGTIDRLRIDPVASGAGAWALDTVALSSASGSGGDDTGDGDGQAEVVHGGEGCGCASRGGAGGAGLVAVAVASVLGRRRERRAA